MHLVRFWDTYVWYHQGGDEPGNYVVQLFANGVLTNNLEYTVGSVPVASPEPTLAPEKSFTAGAPRLIMLSLSATLGGAT